MRSAMLLLEKLNFEFDAILHSVGCNQDMSALLRDSATCWDWSVLILQSPSVQRRLAFRRVVEKLRPILIQTLYPTGNPFGGVSPYWPSDDVLCMQYMKLARRVRDAASGAKYVPEEVRKETHGWVDRTKAYVVRPLWVNRIVEQVCRRYTNGRPGAQCLRPAALISCFVAKLPDEAYAVWEVSL